ncbi:MAG TPA: hypothetical protein DCM28_05230 [Phycisphaerales bacterium]|nr:hypothetical protein [Phycisphaerales bacterium]HCD31118.1 hypothetical protein [Phycisphaerales bacterium]|tara:strand:- start:1112 stop:1345 length:234 start_codon:yes stop_codon:yes gene_type:complete
MTDQPDTLAKLAKKMRDRLWFFVCDTNPDDPYTRSTKDMIEKYDLLHPNDEQVSKAMHLLAKVEDAGLTVEQAGGEG